MTRWQWLAFGAILVVAAFLRLHGLESLALNNDEIVEARWSSESLFEMFEKVQRDKVHPPLDYVVQYVISKTGGPEWVRRIPPILGGIATVAFLMLLGRWWHSPEAGLLAGLFIAASPMYVRYSQEVRPYAMGVFFLAGSLVALELYALTRARRWAFTWFAAVFLAAATLYFAGLVAVIASAARLFDLPDIRKRAPIIVLGWTLLYAPWLGVITSAARGTPPGGPEQLDWPWFQHRLQAYGSGSERYEPVSIGSWAMWIAVLIGLLAAIRAPRLRTAAFWFLGGTLATIIVLRLRPHYAFVPRYILPSMTAVALLAGAGVATMSRWWPTRAVATVIVAAYLLFSGVALEEYYAHGRPDWRQVVRYVYDRARPGDIVILTNDWVIRNFGYYWLQMPKRPGVKVERFVTSAHGLAGPAWIVAGHCRPRDPLEPIGMVWHHEPTEHTRVYYVRPGQTLSLADELCPE